jgi:toxin CcdB
MARFDVYRDLRGRLLLDVQTDLLPSLITRLVVPLLPVAAVPAPMKRLHPVFPVGDVDHVMATHLMAAVPTRSLGRPIGSLTSHYDRIVAAIDMIFLGF